MSGAEIEVRRARRGDIPAIVALVRKATQSRVRVDESEVTDWLFGKGLWVATQGESLVGVVAWQAENLLSVTDRFYVSPARLWAQAGSRLLEAIEAEANVLMCEANVVLLPAEASKATRTFLQRQGYELQELQALHRIWREVLSEFVAIGGSTGAEAPPGGSAAPSAPAPILMVKRLRERMVMIPI